MMITIKFSKRILTLLVIPFLALASNDESMDDESSDKEDRRMDFRWRGLSYVGLNVICPDQQSPAKKHAQVVADAGKTQAEDETNKTHSNGNQHEGDEHES